MSQNNHTNIDDIVDINSDPSPFLGSGSPEMPPASEKPVQRSEEELEKHIEIHETVEHEPDPEVKKHVDVRKEVPEIPEDVEKLGVQASTPQHFTAQQKVQLPISDDKVLAGKKAPITSSLRWLSEFCIYILKQAHIQLKVAHGKAQRVFKSD